MEKKEVEHNAPEDHGLLHACSVLFEQRVNSGVAMV